MQIVVNGILLALFTIFVAIFLAVVGKRKQWNNIFASGRDYHLIDPSQKSI